MTGCMPRPTAETLADIHEITELKYRYARTLDNKLWDEFADTLTEDVQATYGTAVHGAPSSSPRAQRLSSTCAPH